MCRFSKLLLFSFFFCKDGSDRLMKRASFSCCNFLCVVLAAAYLKYRRCRLSCLPFVWHFFFIVTHTHTHTHTHARTHTPTHARTHPSTHTERALSAAKRVSRIFAQERVKTSLWAKNSASVAAKKLRSRLQEELSTEDFDKIIRLCDKTAENTFVSIKERHQRKFDTLGVLSFPVDRYV